ncbi:divergent polysaccharide deacetylase family protein, partial [Rhodosalinus sp.]
HAAEADLPQDAPRLAIVLIDDGSMPFGPDTLAGVPFPVSVAVDPERPEAQAAMAAYRAKGIEVLIAVSLPEGATPQDAEIASAAWFETLPETVAVIEGRPGALQQDRALAEQVADIVGEAGRGLVFHPRGLNTGLALAERAGVPAATVFRSFGGVGEDARALQRLLDRAGMRARSEGATIVTGPLRPDLVPGLVAWGLASRDAGLALAPVSAVLRDSSTGG